MADGSDDGFSVGLLDGEVDGVPAGVDEGKDDGVDVGTLEGNRLGISDGDAWLLSMALVMQVLTFPPSVEVFAHTARTRDMGDDI